jgi:hypothetical protein
MKLAYRTAVALLAGIAGMAPAPASAQVQTPSPPPAAARETLTNDTVIRLLAAGIGEAAVIGKIRASQAAFDLSTDGLIALKGKGVPNAVIAAMLDPAAGPAAPQALSTDAADPMLPHYPGVYVLNARADDARMTRLNPTASNQVRSSGLIGYAFTMGIAPLDFVASVPSPQARARVQAARPAFYFYFDEAVPRGLAVGAQSIWSTGVGGLTTSPTELSLVRFKVKPTLREARVATANIGGVSSGVMQKDQIAFQTDQVAPGIFKVTPLADLAAGEYGFIQSQGGGGGGGLGAASGITARVFDFGVER